MKNSYIKFTLLALILILTLAGCGSDSPVEEPEENEIESEVPEKSFTSDELSQYNGKDGNPAYVAVDGLVYDFTDLGRWRNGNHNGYEAGKDLTEEIKDISPHGLSVLSRAPVIGTLEN